MFYEGLRLWEAQFVVVFYEGLRLWEVVLLTKLSGAVRPGWSAKENPSRAWGEGEGEGERLDLSCFTRV